MDTGVIAAAITALGALAGVVYAQRGQLRAARDQLAVQAADAERDDAAHLVDLANKLAGQWITRLQSEVDRVHRQLADAQAQILTLTARVEQLTTEVYAGRAERETLRAERDQAQAQVAVLTAQLDQLRTPIPRTEGTTP